MGHSLQWLEKVAERHKEWVQIVRSFGETTYAEDLVQEMYIVLSKYTDETKIIKNGVVSRGYIYFTLRSLYYSLYNNKKKLPKVRIDDEENFCQIADHSEMDEQVAFHKICTMIDEVADGWHWYDKKLFKLYRDTDLSIRKIAAETNISWVSIFNTLKNAKQEIKDKIGEDYIDYKNKDYDRI